LQAPGSVADSHLVLYVFFTGALKKFLCSEPFPQYFCGFLAAFRQL